MTVDRPTPISSGYLKAFSTGGKEQGDAGQWCEEAALGSLPPPLPSPHHPSGCPRGAQLALKLSPAPSAALRAGALLSAHKVST